MMRTSSAIVSAFVIPVLLLFLVEAAVVPALGQAEKCVPGTITTVAGIGDPPDPPDDGKPATEALLDEPWSVAVGKDGSLYVADIIKHQVRKVGADGIITTVAGDGWKDPKTGGQGRYTGDGGPAVRASLSWPGGLALAADGSLYIVDSGNQRIRKVDRSGTITTVAGGGDPPDEVGDGGPATEAYLSHPAGVAVAADGSLYIADTENHRIRRVDTDGIITTVAGAGVPGYRGDGGPATKALLCEPEGVAVATDGTIYVADTWNHRIRRVDTDGAITTVAGDGWKDKHGNGRYTGDDGRATAASLNNPCAVVMGADGGIYIADTFNHRVRKVSRAGVITSVAGDGWRDPSGTARFAGDGRLATEASLWSPNDVAVSEDGTLYIADLGSRRIRRVDPTGVITTVAGRDRDYGDEGPATRARLDNPSDVVVGADGSLYIADTENNRVRRIDPAGVITTVAGTGGPGYSGDGGPATEARLRYPLALALAADGTLYISDSGNERIRRVDTAGIITTIAGDGWRDDKGTGRFAGDGGPATEASLWGPHGLAVGLDGAVYIADTLNGRVRMVDRRGIITTVLALGSPHGIALNADGELYIAEVYHVWKVDRQGLAVVVAGGGRDHARDGDDAKKVQLHVVTDVGVGPDGGIYVVETFNHRVLKVDAAGMVSVVAGSGPLAQNEGGYAGDGGPATEAALNAPAGVALGPDGSIYIADKHNHRIRKVCGGQPARP